MNISTIVSMTIVISWPWKGLKSGDTRVTMEPPLGKRPTPEPCFK